MRITTKRKKTLRLKIKRSYRKSPRAPRRKTVGKKYGSRRIIRKSIKQSIPDPTTELNNKIADIERSLRNTRANLSKPNLPPPLRRRLEKNIQELENEKEKLMKELEILQEEQQRRQHYEEEQKRQFAIDINKNIEFFDPIDYETKEVNIESYLSESDNNIVIAYDKPNYRFFLTDRETIENSLRNEDCSNKTAEGPAIFYPCKKVGEGSALLFYKNIERETPLFNLKRIGFPDERYFYLDNYLQNKTHQLFVLYGEGKRYDGLASKQLVRCYNENPNQPPSTVSRLHCQVGSDGKAYELKPAYPLYTKDIEDIEDMEPPKKKSRRL